MPLDVFFTSAHCNHIKGLVKNKTLFRAFTRDTSLDVCIKFEWVIEICDCRKLLVLSSKLVIDFRQRNIEKLTSIELQTRKRYLYSQGNVMSVSVRFRKCPQSFHQQNTKTNRQKAFLNGNF